MYKVNIKDSEKFFQIDTSGNSIMVDNEVLVVDIEKIRDNLYHVLKDYKGYSIEIIAIKREEKEVTLRINEKTVVLQLQDEMDLLLEKMGMGAATLNKVADVKSPMPGLVLDIKVQVGDAVEKGTPLLILEAMKMENNIKSVGAGVVKAVNVKKGDAVEKNEILLVME